MKAVQPMIAQRFRRALDTYDAEARAQAEIAVTLTNLLADAGAPESFARVLEFGCGTGGFTRHLARRVRPETLYLNDLVTEAGALAAQVANGEAGFVETRFLPGPIETLIPPAGLDLIASNTTLQWVADPAALLERLTAALKPGGWLAVSSFARSHFPELQACGIAPIASGYRDATEWPALLPPGLDLLALESRAITLRFTDARSLLRHFRYTGVNGDSHAHWTRNDLLRFEADLSRVSIVSNGLSLTYHPVWLIATRRLA